MDTKKFKVWNEFKMIIKYDITNKKYSIHKKVGEFFPVTRPDGLKVFISEKDPELLNRIKLHNKNKKIVILATGIYNGLKVANNYNKEHGGTVLNYTDLFKAFVFSLDSIIEDAESGTMPLTFTMTDQPEVCPICAIRTEIIKEAHSGKQVHHCPSCDFLYILKGGDA